MHRRTNYSASPWGITTDRSGSIWIAMLIIVVFGSCFTSGIYASMVSDHNDVREGQFKVIHVLEDTSRDLDPSTTASTMATSLLQTHGRKLGVSELDDKAFRMEVEKTATTGTLPTPTYARASWDEFSSVWLPWGLASIVWLLTMVLCLCYADECSRRHEYLADFKVRRPSQLLFILLTPQLWLFYAISGVRMKYFHRPPEPYVPRPRPPRVEEVVEIIRATVEKKTFDEDRDGALETYSKIRNDGLYKGVERRKSELADSLASFKSQAAELSKAMRTTQRNRTKAKTELDELEARNISPETVLDAATIQEEFNRLLAYDGVRKIRPIKNGLLLLVEARLTYKGNVYDLGDWELKVQTTHNVEAKEFRRGVRPGWDGGYPAYRLGADGFCFGYRVHEMNEHARKGQFLEAVSLAVQSLCSVNEVHLDRIPDAFKKIQEVETNATSDAATTA